MPTSHRDRPTTVAEAEKLPIGNRFTDEVEVDYYDPHDIITWLDDAGVTWMIGKTPEGYKRFPV